MAIFTPVFSKNTISAGTVQQLYICPADKSHAYVDLSFFKEVSPGNSLISVAVTTESNPANLTSLDYFLDDIELRDAVNVATLKKVLVGTNERIYVKVVSGETVNVRLNAFEEINTKVQKAGRLSALSVTNTNSNLLFENTYTGISYINGSLTVYNPSSTNNANINIWIGTGTTPDLTDKILKFELTTEDTAVIENVTIAPDEKIFVQSDIVNTEFFVNGVIVKS